MKSIVYWFVYFKPYETSSDVKEILQNFPIYPESIKNQVKVLIQKNKLNRSK